MADMRNDMELLVGAKVVTWKRGLLTRVVEMGILQLRT